MTTRAEQEPIGSKNGVSYTRSEDVYSESPEQLREWEIAQRWQPHTAKPVDYLPPPDDRL